MYQPLELLWLSAMPPKAKVQGEIVGHAGGVPFEVVAWGGTDTLCVHRADCGLKTAWFCDYCYAKDRDPAGDYAGGQLTPLCSACDSTHGECHFCRGLQWAVPPPHG